MNDTTQAVEGTTETVAAVETPATEAVTTETPVTTEVKTEEPKKAPWFQTRIDHITKEKYEEKRARESAEARIRELEAQLSGGSTTQTHAQPIDPASIHRLAAEQAQEIVRQQNFNQSCNRVYESGKKELGPEFDTAIQNFNMLGGLAAHPALVEVATTLPDGHKVLHHLGTNLDEASRILSLPPMQMALEVARISNEVKRAKVSNAPPPIKPINGSTGTAVAGPDENGDFPDQASFRRWREQQRKKA